MALLKIFGLRYELRGNRIHNATKSRHALGLDPGAGDDNVRLWLNGIYATKIIKPDSRGTGTTMMMDLGSNFL